MGVITTWGIILSCHSIKIIENHWSIQTDKTHWRSWNIVNSLFILGPCISYQSYCCDTTSKRQVWRGDLVLEIMFALPEGLSLIPSAPCQISTLSNSSSRISDTFFCPLQVPSMHLVHKVQTGKHLHTQADFLIKRKCFTNVNLERMILVLLIVSRDSQSLQGIINW